MGTTIKKITKKSWFYFLGTGGIAAVLFAKMFLGGMDIISLLKLESDAKNAIMQTGVISVANADVPGDGGGGSGDSCDDADGCSDAGSY